MKLDDIARTAVSELRTATARASLTVRAPTAGRPRWVLGLVAAALIAILAPAAWLAGSGRRPAAGPQAVVSPTTPEGLVAAVYVALQARDDTALAALAMPNARHGSYLLVSGAGETPVLAPGESFPYAAAGLATAGPIRVEATGAPLIVGDVVAVPVEYLYPDRVLSGFDVYALTTVPDGLRIRGGASFLGQLGIAPDPSASERVADYIAAWNSGSQSQVMTLLGQGVVIWDDIATGDPTMAYVGDRLGGFISRSLWFDVEMTGPSVASGPFLALPNRLVTSIDTSDGISVLLLYDGLIYLHAFAQ